jgi:hypothetical protein
MASATTASPPAGLKEQIEFYFSDSNYPGDKFLREEAKKRDDEFIALSVLPTFNRVKQYTTDVAVIAEALKDSDGKSQRVQAHATGAAQYLQQELLDFCEFWLIFGVCAFGLF